MFQPATYINTSVFRQVLIDATPNQNTNNVLDNFNGIVDSMKSGIITSWTETFKTLQLVDFLLHMAHAETFPWAKQNIHQIEGLIPPIQDEYGRKRVKEELGVIKWLLQDETRIFDEVRAPSLYHHDGPPPWLVRCYDMPVPQRQVQTSPPSQNKLDRAVKYSNPTFESGSGSMARQAQNKHNENLPMFHNDQSPRLPVTPKWEGQERFHGIDHGNSNDDSAVWDSTEQTITSVPRQQHRPLPPIFRKSMERSEENLHATGLSFLNRENYDELHDIFRRFVPKGAVTMSKHMAYNAMRGGIEVDDSQVGLILSWCDVDQLGELFFPDFALAFYMLVVIASQQKPLGVGDTAQLRAEVSRKVTQLTGGCTRRQFLERQKAQQSRETEDHKNRYVSQTEDDDFDDTIRPDDLVTQVPVKRKRRKRRDRTSQPANEVPSTIKPTVNGREDSDKSLRMAVNHESHSGRSIASTPSGSFNSSRSATSDLVRDSKLETVISNNGALVQHISYESNPRMRQRRLRKEQTWKRVRELGGGGFGCVWLEERLNGDDGGGTFRAVKEISKIQPQGQHISINYNRELEAIAKFSHSKSLGWYESEHSIFIAMEYMEHGDLQGYLSRPFHEEETKQIIFQLLEGLCFMHDNGFAHRDLKPANILVSEPSPHWWVKIGDFGISKRAEKKATAFRTLVGTRGYLAPEVMGIYSTEDVMGVHPAGDDSSSIYTVAVDIWALGAIMFRLLNNRNAFGDPHRLARYVTAKGPFPRDGRLKQDVSRSCMEFLEHAMARSPKDRPTSHQALNHAWFGDLHDSASSPEALLEKLSIASGNLPQRKRSFRDEDTAPSADWPSTFD
ncbi:unnamed protein product [Clonostachys rosea f. rosea IK726]|uniref:Protein kinase domain-containing protein n=2 Tax=Bionectria ochroleuca TaxID=29856 RepID=A0A0B7JTA2_BIOOC|nr:unnamed protein product [Clonostachys rosea f. rosea IK726]